MPKTKETRRTKKTTGSRIDSSAAPTSSTPGRRPATRQTSITTRASIARGGTNSTPRTTRSTQRTTKRTNTTAQSSPRAKRQRVRGQPEPDSSTSSEDDSEVFDDAPLTRADIPKIVEAVMNQFSSAPREERRDSPHLGKLPGI